MHLYIGIDWSEQKHDVAFVNEQGALVQQIDIVHSEQGFEKLNRHRQKLHVPAEACIVGLETAHTLLVDYLWLAGYEQVYVLAPNVASKNRGRYRQSAAKDDKWDAFLIGDILRTNRQRFYPWQPGSELLQQMRATVSFHRYLTKQTTATSNRLRAVLLVKFGEDRERFPSPAAVQALAGTCPVTIQSGKSRSVRFRRACDREFRHIAQLHARTSLRSSAWAGAYYNSTLSRNPSKNHALRCVANRWLKVIWTLWQKRTCYDETLHMQHIVRHRSPVPTA